LLSRDTLAPHEPDYGGVVVVVVVMMMVVMISVHGEGCGDVL
jgi:hypothetical protein